MNKLSLDILAAVRLIVVHAGAVSHQDEQVATALAVAFGATNTIERRDPTADELADPTVLVLDVGMTHDWPKHNIDHHQRTREEEPQCAYSLLAQDLGCWDQLKLVFPWAEAGRFLDVTGPFATAKRMGTEWPKIQGLYGPAGSYVSRRWAEDAEFRAEYAADLADTISSALRLFGAARAKVGNGIDIAGFKVCDVRMLDADCRQLQDALAAAIGANAILFDDDRGPGLGVMRFNDDPHIDFRQCAGMPDVGFVHQSGFILKTLTKDADLEALLKAARVQ